MKNTRPLGLLLALLCTTAVFSQKDSTAPAGDKQKQKPVIEIGTSIYGLIIRPGDFYTKYSLVRDYQLFSGMYLKCHRGNHALRYSIEYSRRSVYFGKSVISRFSSNKSELASLELKFGYQRLLGTKKFAPYIFADAEYTFFRTFNYPIYDYYYASSSIYPNYNYRYYSINGSFLSLSPGLGIRWAVKPHVYINAEAAAQLFYGRERILDSYELANTIGINAKPLKLSIGFTF